MKKTPAGKDQVWCAECFACSVCGAKPTIGSKFQNVLTGVFAVTLCETHLNSFRSYHDKTLEELPDELLDAQLKRLTYLRNLDQKHANEALQSSMNPGKLNAVGSILSVVGGNYGSANWWQLDRMNKSAVRNSQYQMYMNGVASLDSKIAQVKKVIEDRKQPKVQYSSERSSDDPISVLKLRFAKGEIDKNEYEEKLKLLG